MTRWMLWSAMAVLAVAPPADAAQRRCELDDGEELPVIAVPPSAVPFLCRLGVVLGAIAALAIGIGLYGGRERAVGDAAGYARGHAEFTKLQADMTAKALAATAAARSEESRRAAAIQENAYETQRPCCS